MALTKVGKEGITGIDNSSDATAITITSAENIGIGDSSPDDKLTVYGGLARIGTGDSNHIRMGRNTSSGDFEMQRTLSGVTNQVFLKVKEANNGNIILNEGGGNVGIGTSSPDNLLHIKTTGSTPSIELEQDAGTSYKALIKLAGNDLEIRGSSGSLEFYNGSQDGDSSALVMKADATGAITKPLQPAFMAQLSGSQNNFAVASAVTVAFAAERFDQNADYDTSNYTFTAPVTGRYQINIGVNVTTLDSAASYYQIRLVTSNRSYYSTVDPDFGQDNNYFELQLAVLADMDASDTALVQIYQSNGTQQSDIDGSSAFSGYLVA